MIRQFLVSIIRDINPGDPSKIKIEHGIMVLAQSGVEALRKVRDRWAGNYTLAFDLSKMPDSWDVSNLSSVPRDAVTVSRAQVYNGHPANLVIKAFFDGHEAYIEKLMMKHSSC